MKNSTILRVILLGVIAMTGIIAMQSYWVISTWNINEEEFNKKVNLALYNVAKIMADLNGSTLPARDVIKRRTSNYYIVNIANEIDTDILEHYLQREFEALALNIDFEYAVFDCHTNEMVYGNYCSYNPTEKRNLDLGNLPKDSEFTYYFGVKFPTRSGYLFGKMQLSIFFSVILLITVSFFTYSMWVILRQKRLSEMQKDFINNMTHEFKTPISTIKIAADVFMQNPGIQSNQRLLQYANIIKEQSRRLNHQVEKVLQLARVERSNFEIKRELLNLNELVRDVAESVTMQVEELGGHLIIEDAKTPAFINADRVHLTNILHNLLDNAVKYCKGAPDIKLAIEVKDKQVFLSISDKGIGISKEHQAKVFDKFFRVPTGDVHNVKGFGLGLFYVKNICTAHGWRIRLQSMPGQGTNITIALPKAGNIAVPATQIDQNQPSIA